mmetsp:Transcript_58925/g.120619  ORF Transcript_58925/g.120619 Transcript_58925/m.120619 type:complete len:152 (+) Transcript_58925:71-526(+)|eukprot:CAMPEP_0181324634 /NCGR_PEP_ID=MMETSP1101-20121128/20471_1 /TAXON_ID=46948 /ORGANISM="Rhodomonas abbreviata, Strain Caron Lab Isolate" /LENGTH=151 /DNA_ID=CAMNT_0023432837 /DNA_START=55 /DNA_END=510 /DNA_ORIENTATION=+
MFTPQRFSGSIKFARSQAARNFHAGGKKSSGVLEADGSKQMNSLYHKSAVALAALTPVAFVLSPSVANMPVDLVLGVLFPFHSHVALNYVISDYVPKASRGPARALLLAATLVAAAGILKLNVQGPGLTETVKSMWRAPSAAAPAAVAKKD